MKQQVTKILSSLLFVVFFYGIAPREYLHDLFANHHDTQEAYHRKGDGTYISAKHQHCAFFSFEVDTFIATAKQYFSFEQIAHTNQWVSPIYHYHFSNTHRVVSLRGPPAC